MNRFSKLQEPRNVCIIEFKFNIHIIHYIFKLYICILNFNQLNMNITTYTKE